MTITLRRGDTATVTFADLATAAAATLPTFLAGDVIAFTVRRDYESPTSVLALTSADGGVTFNAGFATGAVNIASTSWHRMNIGHDVACVWDLQLTRGANVSTVATGTLMVEPDVTRPNTPQP